MAKKKKKTPLYLGLYANDDGDVVYVWEVCFLPAGWKPGNESVVYTPVKLRGRMLRGDADRVADWKGYDTQEDFLEKYPHRVDRIVIEVE